MNPRRPDFSYTSLAELLAQASSVPPLPESRRAILRLDLVRIMAGMHLAGMQQPDEKADPDAGMQGVA